MKRLLDDSIAPELQDILRSAEEDLPRAADERQDKILAAIATASTVGTAATATVAAVSRADGVVRIAKWAAPLLGVVAAATFAVVSSSRAPAPSSSEGSASAPAAVTSETRSEAQHPSEPAPAVPGMRVEDLPTAAAPAQRPAPRLDENRAHPSASGARDESSGAATGIHSGREAREIAPPAEPNIDAEIAAIDKARGALTTERPAEALARVQTYRSTFAAPHFADEADAIEVQALAALGRKDEARRKGEEFLTRRPRSPYAQRVRSAAGLN